MAVVPNLTSFSVQSPGGSSARVTSEPVRDTAGAQLQEFGRGLQDAGTAAAAITLDMQQKANQLRVDDALNSVKETALDLTYDPEKGFTNLKGNDALHRPDGKSITDEYGGQLKSRAEEVAKGLGNEAQREAFMRGARQIQMGFDTDVVKHYNSEFKTYTLSVDDGMIATAKRDIGLNYTDTEKVGNSISRIRAAVARSGQLLGLSAVDIEEKTRAFIGDAHVTAMAAALDTNDIGFVEEYMKLHGDELTAEQHFQISGKVNKQKDMTYATDVASEIDGGTSAGVAAETFVSPVKGVVTSGYGNRKPFRTKNGQMASQIHDGIDIDGNLNDPVAAAGTGVVVRAGRNGGYGNYVEIKHADGTTTFYGHLNTIGVKEGDTVKRGQSIGGMGESGNATGVHLHWGAKNAKGQSIDPRAIKGSAGGPGTGSNATLLEKLQRVRSDPRLVGHPERMAEAERQIRSLEQARQQGKSDAEEQRLNSAMRAILQNGGNLTPQIAGSVEGKYLPSLQSFATGVENHNQDPAGGNNPALWAQLKTDIIDHPNKYKSPDALLQYAPLMSKQQFGDLMTDAIAINNPTAKTQNEFATLKLGLGYIDTELRAAGFDTSPKEGTDAAKDFAAFRASYITQLRLLRDEKKGGAITAKEARDLGLRLLAEVPSGVATVKGVPDAKRVYQLPQGGLARVPFAKIPEIDRVEAARALRAMGYHYSQHNIEMFYAGYDFPRKP